MKVLILHKIAYSKMVYHSGIDHDAHDVVYVGTAEKIKDIPSWLRCRTLIREDLGPDVCNSVLAALVNGSHQDLGGARPVDRIISLSESELLEAAKVRDALGVPGPGFADACLVRDKVAMKVAITAAGIDAPRFVPLSALQDSAAAPGWIGKTVLKPTHGAGSEDVVIYDSAAAALAAISDRKSGVTALDGAVPALNAYELEEFVDGPIVHFDGLVRDGVVELVVASRYIGTCQRYNENEPLGSYQFDLDAERHVWIQRVIDAVRIGNGAFHLEAIESARGLVFLEIGNRIGGAGVSQATSLTLDADFQKLELELLLDDCPTDLTKLGRRGRYFGWYLVPGHRHADGQWVASSALERLKIDKRVVTWHQREAAEGFDEQPDYDLPAVPFGGIVGAERSEHVHDFMVKLFAALEWRSRG